MAKTSIYLAPVNRPEVQLICHCCRQPYHPVKAWQDQLNAVVLGAEKYAICPVCTQQVTEEMFNNEAYRWRCRQEVARLQRLFEAEMASRKSHLAK